MNKVTIIAFLIALSIGSLNSQAKAEEAGFDPEFLKPENVEKILDVAINESEKHMGGIADIYHQYMGSLTKYAKKQVGQFQRFFSEDAGQANKGYIPTKEVD